MSRSEDAVRIIERLGVPRVLAGDLVSYMTKIGDEIRTSNLEKSSTGKFVETVVQVLQAISSPSRKYDQTVKNVEEVLLKFESRTISGLNNESRLGIVRVARAIQCMRNKRSLVHKNQVDPNAYDLEFVYRGAQWIVTEFVRLGSNSTIDDAVGIVTEIQRPIVPIVENVVGRPLVLDTDMSTPDEILVILYHGYSKEGTMTRTEIGDALSRRGAPAVSKALKKLWTGRLIDGSTGEGYRLTATGIVEAREIIARVLARDSDKR
jgi:hypothetical protein